MEIFNYFQIFSHKCSVRSHLTLYGIITRFLKMFPSLLPCHSAFMYQVFPKSALLFSYTSSCNVLNTATPLLSNLVQRYICSRSPHLWLHNRKKCSQSPHKLKGVPKVRIKLPCFLHRVFLKSAPNVPVLLTKLYGFSCILSIYSELIIIIYPIILYKENLVINILCVKCLYLRLLSIS